jgi:LysM repeat protein
MFEVKAMKRRKGVKNFGTYLILIALAAVSYYYYAAYIRGKAPTGPVPPVQAVAETLPALKDGAPEKSGQCQKSGGGKARRALEEAKKLYARDEREGLFALLTVSRRFAGTTEGHEAAKRLAEMARAYRSEGDKLLGAGAEWKARTIYSLSYFCAFSEKERAGITKKLDGLNEKLIFSRHPSPGSIMYTVQPGDSLYKIARKFKTEFECIMEVNRLRGTRLRVGDRLKILKGVPSIWVSKRDFRLVLLLDGVFLKEYTVGIGKEDRTPEAEFTITVKLKNPTWYSRKGIFPPGHEKNILGTRWLGFENTREFSGFGIHGSAKGRGVGEASSAGCIRMRNEDVQELYALVPTGTKVRITP